MKSISPNSESRIDIAEINQLALQPARFVASCEDAYNFRLDELCRRVADAPQIRVVLLAGPSSSGKTTTAHKLADRLTAAGRPASVVSLDDFYLGMEQYRRLPDGTPDMESVDALDLPLINSTLGELMANGSALFPTFDFENSRRGSVTNRIEIGERGVIVMEGLHALNPRLITVLSPDSLFRVYISTRTLYLDGEREILTPRDARLIRRMVRDHNFRARSPLMTLSGWHNTVGGEEKYILPFRDTANFTIDSSFDYEGCIFHHYILPMLEELKSDENYRGKVRQIVDILEAFEDIDFRYVPTDSLLREFIGARGN